MITDPAIDALLFRIQEAPKETLTSRTVLFEGLLEGEEAEEEWKDLTEADGKALRAAIRIGLVHEDYLQWRPKWPDDLVPDGGDYIVTLTGFGTERLIQLNEPRHRRWLRQIAGNIPTIVVSVVSGLLIAAGTPHVKSWADRVFGAPQSAQLQPKSASGDSLSTSAP